MIPKANPSDLDIVIDFDATLNNDPLPDVLVELAVAVLVPAALVVDAVPLPVSGSTVTVLDTIDTVELGIELNRLNSGITFLVVLVAAAPLKSTGFPNIVVVLS